MNWLCQLDKAQLFWLACWFCLVQQRPLAEGKGHKWSHFKTGEEQPVQRNCLACLAPWISALGRPISPCKRLSVKPSGHRHCDREDWGRPPALSVQPGASRRAQCSSASQGPGVLPFHAATSSLSSPHENPSPRPAAGPRASAWTCVLYLAILLSQTNTGCLSCQVFNFRLTEERIRYPTDRLQWKDSWAKFGHIY